MKACAAVVTKIIRILIADDHPVVREGLAAVFQSQPDMALVAEAADGEQALAFYDEFSPDVLILDLRMPKLDGLQVLAELMSRGDPKPRVLVMTAYASEEDVRRAITTGAKGLLVKGADSHQIREAVRAIAAGQAFLPAKIVSTPVHQLVERPVPRRAARKTAFAPEGQPESRPAL